MSDHVCHWDPIEGERGRYSCSCGAQAYKDFYGKLRLYKIKPPTKTAPTARPIMQPAPLGRRVNTSED